MLNIFRRKRLTRVNPAVAINEVVNPYISPLFKDEGFKKNGHTWLKNYGEYSFIVNVQASKWNGQEEGASFVINYGIFVPSTYEESFRMAVPSNPKEYDCIYRQRIKDKKGNEIWWKIFNHTDVDKIGEEVIEALNTQTMPLFESVKGLSDVEALLKNQKRDFPFTPKSTKSLEPGDFWSIPLHGNKYACGRVLQLLEDNSKWPRKNRIFLAGLMDWVGDRPPTNESIAGCGLHSQGLAHILTISDTGHGIDGNRPLELDNIQLKLLKFPNSKNSGWELFHGTQFVRELKANEVDEHDTLNSWDREYIRELAKDLLNKKA